MEMLQENYLESVPQVSNSTQLGETPNLDLRWNETGPVQSQQLKQASSHLDSDKISTTRISEIARSGSYLPKQTALRASSSVLESKMRKYTWIWILASTFVILSAFLTYFAYELLIRESAVPRALELSPGRTVLVINVLSQSLAFLGHILFNDVMEALRWTFLCRKKGVLLATFLGLSRATSMYGVAYLCSIKGSHLFWCIQRLVFSAAIFFVGIVLTSNINFRNVYTIDKYQTIDVIAGLAPINSFFFTNPQASLVSMFSIGYTVGFMTDPKWVTSVAPISCSGSTDCISLFLPGGLDMVHLTNYQLHATLFDGQYSQDYSTIIVHDAPGFQVEFSSVDPGFSFNSTDCDIYGNATHQGIYICMASEEQAKLFVGWTICPSLISEQDLCHKNTSWTSRFDALTSVVLYKRYATVAYDARNLSILSVQSISEPAPASLPLIDFYHFLTTVFSNLPADLGVPNPANPANATSYVAQYGFGWLLRLYQDDYPADSHSALSLLRGFITVPIQYSSLAWLADMPSMPSDMKTKASLAQVEFRAMTKRSTLVIFCVLVALIAIWSIGCMIWVCFKGPYSPNSSLFPEIDIVSKCRAGVHLAGRRNPHDAQAEDEMSVEDLQSLMQNLGLGNGGSKGILERLGKQQIFCGARLEGNAQHGRKFIVITAKGTEIESLDKKEKYV